MSEKKNTVALMAAILATVPLKWPSDPGGAALYRTVKESVQLANELYEAVDQHRPE